MWIKDRTGSLINSRWLLSLYVDTDPANSEYYVVRGNIDDPSNPGGDLATTFGNAAPSTMSEEDAQDVLDQLSRVLGTFEPSPV